MYRKDRVRWLKHADFIMLDLICLQLAYVLAYGVSGYGFHPYLPVIYRSMAFFLFFADLLVIFGYGTMRNILKTGFYHDFVVTMNHSFMVGALAILYLFLLQKGQHFSRLTLILTILFYLILSYTVRELRKKQLRKQMADGGKRRLFIITTQDIAEQVIQNMQKNNYARFFLAGAAVIDQNWIGREISGVTVVADGKTAVQYVCQEWIDEVLVVTSEQKSYSKEMIEQLSETGITVHLNLAEIINTSGKKQFVEKIGNYTVLTTSIKYTSTMELMLKRCMDIAGGLVGCILTGIIFLFVAPAIYIASPGPIFFSQERVGRNGKKFKMYKFRSMYLDAEARKAELMKENKLGDGKMFKLDFDPRVIGNEILPDGTHKTGIGDFIRRTSLDEFPQFFNVLKGEMSIVGTRPPLLSETSLYEPHHHARLAIKPGITGMWQVSGRSDITDFEEVVRLDKEYIENWNLGMDIKILFKTVMVVLRKDGSV